jgi:Spx/MgsR family transcriptional regulator
MPGDIRFYCWSKCSTCREARLALRELGIEFVERDFFRDPLTEAEIRKLCSLATVDNVFSWNSPRARDLKERREDITEDELIGLMLGEPRLIRRPMLVSGDEIVIGFKQDQYRGLVGSE